jgi:hypothetical protein
MRAVREFTLALAAVERDKRAAEPAEDDDTRGSESLAAFLRRASRTRAMRHSHARNFFRRWRSLWETKKRRMKIVSRRNLLISWRSREDSNL